MIQRVGFENGQLRFELVVDEIIGLSSTWVVDYNRMTKMYIIWLQILNRKDGFIGVLGLLVYMFAEKDTWFVPVRSLARGIAEAV
jgi:hypothetical protein